MSRLHNVRWIEFPSVVDERGALTFVEGAQDVPFEIKRAYYLYDVRLDRGGHAHRDTQQVIVALRGRFVLELSDGVESRRFALDSPTRGVHILPMLFIRLLDFAPDTVVLVLASTHYDKSRSIRSWEDYLQEARGA
ncbi:sugar 3,4-ketoisomerase [Sorangium sp. So ce1153]|uniref:sugar 3,4-ketoisomerase n=1 Tax=Sorangium sp. So ce1153 TaxID=3133333 RepID=UPI003F6080AB